MNESSNPIFACWCVAPSQHELVYLYGPSDDCAQIVVGLGAGHPLHRDDHRTLVNARRSSEQGAKIASGMRCGLERARAMSVAEYLAEWGSTMPPPVGAMAAVSA